MGGRKGQGLTHPFTSLALTALVSSLPFGSPEPPLSPLPHVPLFPFQSRGTRGPRTSRDSIHVAVDLSSMKVWAEREWKGFRDGEIKKYLRKEVIISDKKVRVEWGNTYNSRVRAKQIEEKMLLKRTFWKGICNETNTEKNAG